MMGNFFKEGSKTALKMIRVKPDNFKTNFKNSANHIESYPVIYGSLIGTGVAFAGFAINSRDADKNSERKYEHKKYLSDLDHKRQLHLDDQAHERQLRLDKLEYEYRRSQKSPEEILVEKANIDIKLEEAKQKNYK